MNWLRKPKQEIFLPPTPGNWYVDKTGTLFKVRVLTYASGVLRYAVIDYPQGPRRKVAIEDWNSLIFRLNDKKRGGSSREREQL
jgi:hypothetical protein